MLCSKAQMWFETTDTCPFCLRDFQTIHLIHRNIAYGTISVTFCQVEGLESAQRMCYNKLEVKNMFREMRRKKQQLPDAECIELLKNNTSGVLAVCGDDGYPYAVPVSYVFADGAVYFHCAKAGHKLDAVKACDKVSFCVIDQDQVVPEAYTTRFRSVILFGRAKILEQEREIRSAIEKLAVKYHPADSRDHRDAEIEKSFHAMCMVKIEIEHITGKESIELTRERQKG